MQLKFEFNWSQFMGACRSVGAVLLVQGLVLGLVAASPQFITWAKGFVLVGLLVWAGASLVRPQDGD